MGEIQKVIGLMSGTSLDGVDAALIETDGVDVVRPAASLTVPYDVQTRALLRAAIDTARGMERGDPVPVSITDAERHLTLAHVAAVKALLQKAGPADLIGFHGQTILHRPQQGWTWQIGDGALLAQTTGIDVINDFRSADVAAGGQGAPLVPLYHAALAKGSPLARPLAVVNIGGVANVTYMDGDTVLAFDTGPGNAPIDDWMQRHAAKPVDENGAFAATGTVDEAVLAKMLANSFFDRLPPKSLDRMDFGMDAVESLIPANGAATLTAFTAASIARAAEHFPQAPKTWIVCGGGRHNASLMAMLVARIPAQILKAEGARWDGDALEAEAFAYLALRSKRGLPLSLPSTTGVKEPMTGGRLYRRSSMNSGKTDWSKAWAIYLLLVLNIPMLVMLLGSFVQGLESNGWLGSVISPGLQGSTLVLASIYSFPAIVVSIALSAFSVALVSRGASERAFGFGCGAVILSFLLCLVIGMLAL